MQKYTTFLDLKNQYYENDYTTQSNLQIQCSLDQIKIAFSQYWMLGAGALGRPRGMEWGGRR